MLALYKSPVLISLQQTVAIKIWFFAEHFIHDDRKQLVTNQWHGTVTIPKLLDLVKVCDEP